MIHAIPAWARDRKYSLGFLALLLFACYDLWIHPALFDGREMSLCLMKNVWGIPCPACGTAHGVQHLVQGDVRAAFMDNPLSILVAVFFPFFLLVLTLDLVSGKGHFEKWLIRIDDWRKKFPWIIWLSAGLLLLNWIWNFQKWK